MLRGRGGIEQLTEDRDECLNLRAVQYHEARPSVWIGGDKRVTAVFKACYFKPSLASALTEGEVNHHASRAFGYRASVRLFIIVVICWREKQADATCRSLP